jgi:hypothetical protein
LILLGPTILDEDRPITGILCIALFGRGIPVYFAVDRPAFRPSDRLSVGLQVSNALRALLDEIEDIRSEDEMEIQQAMS